MPIEFDLQNFIKHPTPSDVHFLTSPSAPQRAKMCCSKKCACHSLVWIMVALDAGLNLFFMTRAFTQRPQSIAEFHFNNSLHDVWLISVLRDVFLLIISLLIATRHHFAYSLLCFLHKKYLTAFACLAMYSYAMIKMLLLADQAHRETHEVDRISMLMLIGNVIAAFLFFVACYALVLLKPKESNYQKTDVDGGDPLDYDIFIETLKETQKKRSSLLRLFRYSMPDWPFISVGTLFLLLGAICKLTLGEIVHQSRKQSRFLF